MKKKIAYIFGTVISLIASIFSSATASACGGDMGYVQPKSFPNIIVTSRPSKTYTGSKVFVDGLEAPVTSSSNKTNQSEKQRILSVIKEATCFAVAEVNEEKIEAILKKHGFKADIEAFDALHSKYINDAAFLALVDKTMSQAMEKCSYKQ